jgi:hypothetical protein
MKNKWNRFLNRPATTPGSTDVRSIRFHTLIFSVAAVAVGTQGPAGAGEHSSSGYAAGEARIFFNSPIYTGQKDEPNFSLVVRPEYSYRSDDRANQLRLVPFLRLDSIDERRTHADIREGYWRRLADDWELLIGVNKVFWGVTESQHLVDIINQTDLVEDIDGEDKLGQPMLMLGSQRDWGELQFYLLPYFRERTFPGESGRLRREFVVDTDRSEFESGAEEFHPDFSLRYSHYLGDWDLGAYYFYGTGREPLFRINEISQTVVPVYTLIHQAGLDLQYTHEAWLWKFEGILREGRGDPFGALVAGFEYTLYQVARSSADLGLLLEYNYDGRDRILAPPTVFDNDVFAGSRLALNDEQSSELLLGVTIDVDTGTVFGFLEAERRVGDEWKIEIQSRLFANVADSDPAFALRKDDFLNLSLQRHF